MPSVLVSDDVPVSFTDPYVRHRGALGPLARTHLPKGQEAHAREALAEPPGTEGTPGPRGLRARA
ncbi:hypothetical protein [Streptomyces sp. NPDC057496]|uniref:hypothetical protein n=1 Tax=Streptomyces sp. NPDC057496 TaxID=3346149 RepID=UPI00367BD84C